MDIDKCIDFVNELLEELVIFSPEDLPEILIQYICEYVKVNSLYLIEALAGETNDLYKANAISIIQIVAYQTFNKLVALIRSEISLDLQKDVANRVAFVTYEILKMFYDELGSVPVSANSVIETYTKNIYEEAIVELYSKNLIDEKTKKNALKNAACKIL